MSSLETIVRPFQTGQITPPRLIPDATPSSASSTVFNIGENGSPKTMSGAFNLTINYYYIKTPKEEVKNP